MAGAEREDPLPNFRFLVEIDGMVLAGFSEVRGLSMAVDEREGSDVEDDDTATTGDQDRSWWERVFGWGSADGRDSHATPDEEGRQLATTSPPLELRRGVTENTELWAWYDEWLEGDADRRNVRVVLLDEYGAQARAWECRAAKPVRWVGPTLVADDSGVAIETFELEHEGIWRMEGL